MSSVNAGNEHDSLVPSEADRSADRTAAAADDAQRAQGSRRVDAPSEAEHQSSAATGGAPDASSAWLEDELDDAWDNAEDLAELDENVDARPLEELVDSGEGGDELEKKWYILKVQVNRENSICEALTRQVKKEGMERYFEDLSDATVAKRQANFGLVPTEDVREYNKSGKQKIVKRKLYPGYVVVKMFVNEDSWQLVRGTPGIGDFTGAAGKPVPLSDEEIARIIATTRPEVREGAEETARTTIKFKPGDRVRVKEGYFQNHEGEVSNIDERNGRVTVMINIFGRPNPVELDHWQIESL